MKYIFLLLNCFILQIVAKANNDDSTIVSSSLKTVVVYKSGAEMTHTSTAFLKQGNNELIIDDISNQIDINSVQIKTGSAVTIMGIEFADNYLRNPEKSPRIKFLEDSLNRLQGMIDGTNLLINNSTDLMEVLKANRDIKGSQTGLSVAELIKLMDYYKTKSLELQTNIAKLNNKKTNLQDDADKLQAQITEEEQKNIATSGRLIVQLSTTVAGKFDFTVSYITPNAFWVPFYDIRVDNIKDPMKIIYKAKITQTTGIDWKQVHLSLSTSLPSQWNNAPELNTWFLSYVNPVAYMNKTLYVSPVVANVVQGRTSGVEISTEDNEDKPSADGLNNYLTVSDNTLDVTFDVDIPYDVPTNGKAQTAVLQTLNVPAIYKHFAVPKLDKDPYLLAQVVDWEKLNLLPGEANIIVENTYIGKSVIDPNSTSDTLNLTLGRDKRVVVTREKLADYSSVKFLGSNKLQKYTYEITIRNNKKDSIDLLLKDQYPISTDKDIEVELVDDSKAAIDAETGLLTWKLAMAPGETKKIRFAYTIKYPKNKIVK
jgi:uncharacterized protein (TIGR02231 family)